MSQLDLAQAAQPNLTAFHSLLSEWPAIVARYANSAAFAIRRRLHALKILVAGFNPVPAHQPFPEVALKTHPPAPRSGEDRLRRETTA
jgi:hypothetical protein